MQTVLLMMTMKILDQRVHVCNFVLTEYFSVCMWICINEWWQMRVCSLPLIEAFPTWQDAAVAGLIMDTEQR